MESGSVICLSTFYIVRTPIMLGISRCIPGILPGASLQLLASPHGNQVRMPSPNPTRPRSQLPSSIFSSHLYRTPQLHNNQVHQTLPSGRALFYNTILSITEPTMEKATADCPVLALPFTRHRPCPFTQHWHALPVSGI